jgi:NADPH-dependent 2,4-dienoyl-CoA reductase/sulfur reductase-like enzyme
LFYSSEAELKGRGIIVKMKHRVTDFDFKNQKITVLNLQNNEVLHDSYDKLIVATGSWPIIPNNIPGINLDGIYLSKLFQHAKTIIDKIRSKNVKRIAVIGAGYIGVELAEAFHKHHKEVILIDAESRIMNRYYDEEFTDSVENKMKEAGIELQLNEKLISFKGDDGKLSHVVTDKQEYEVDLAILAIGFKPNTSLVQDKLTTDKRGAIIVDDYFQTSQKNVYAIGDCITIRDNARNKNVNIALATNAIRSGIVAALNAGSEINKYQFSGVQGTNGICVFNEKMVSTGLSETAARVVDSGYKNIKSMYFSDNDRPEFMKENFPVKIKIV